MNLEDVHYRSVIRLLFMKGKSRDEVTVELKSLYADESPSRQQFTVCLIIFKVAESPFSLERDHEGLLKLTRK